METQFADVWQQAWRLSVTLLVPTLAIPLVSALFTFVFGLIGVRDEGVAYSVRVIVLIAVGLVSAPIFASSLVSLMSLALR
jgi:hypothetical protein